MKYYKMISGTNIVGAVTQLSFVRFRPKHKTLNNCEISVAQYVLYDGNLYRDSWLFKLSGSEGLEYSEVKIVEIGEEEYNTLIAAFEKNEEITETTQEEEVQIPEEQVEDNPTIDFVKASKLAEISHACNVIITNGFDIVLSDGETHHFSLTTQDQLNLITLSSLAANGETMIPYHADGELCKFYSPEDITSIVNYATQFKTYHVSYHNALKLYVESLDDLAQIRGIEYGIDIPIEFQSDVLKVLNGRSEENETNP